MWIYDVILPMFVAGIAAITVGTIALRQRFIRDHPEPTLQQQIEELEQLNDSLREQEDKEWAKRLGL